jgi:hypothetical protein
MLEVGNHQQPSRAPAHVRKNDMILTHHVPLHTADLSRFAKALGAQLASAHERSARPPGHLELLNMLARAAGHRNYQSLRAQSSAAAPEAPASPDEPTPEATAAPLSDSAVKALRQFDASGRLLRWPTRRAVQKVMLWGLWLRFDSRRTYVEREVNEILNAWHLYGDHCTLRRELVTAGLLARTPDGAFYEKLPARPDDDTRAFLQALRARKAWPSRRSPASGAHAPA